MTGVIWGGSNDYVIWNGYNGTGLTLKANGSAVLSGSLTQNSDASLKDNVEDASLKDCMNMLENINVKTYTRNDMEEDNKRLGFIAQDVKAYLPEKFDNIIAGARRGRSPSRAISTSGTRTRGAPPTASHEPVALAGVAGSTCCPWMSQLTIEADHPELSGALSAALAPVATETAPGSELRAV